jgi:hypothetical protein
MRKFLLASVAVMALIRPAYALDIVFDPVQETQGIQELAQWVEQIAWMKQQYDQLVLTYNALAHATNLGGIAGALGGLTRNFMPEANVIPELMRDGNNLWGSASYFNSSDLYYVSNLMDKWSIEMERRRGVTSNAKAMAEASTLNAEDHLLKLDVLRSRLESAVDITEVSAINGLIALEQQNLDVHRTQSQNVSLLLAAEERVTVQRDEQMQRESADILWMNTAPISGSLQ